MCGRDKEYKSKRIDLKRRYEDITSRNNPSIRAYLTDRGYYKDEESAAIADRLLQSAAGKMAVTVAAEMPLPSGGGLAELDDLAQMEEVWYFGEILRIVSFLIVSVV